MQAQRSATYVSIDARGKHPTSARPSLPIVHPTSTSSLAWCMHSISLLVLQVAALQLTLHLWHFTGVQSKYLEINAVHKVRIFSYKTALIQAQTSS